MVLNRAKLDRKLPSQGTFKSRSVLFINDGVDLYSSSCMSDTYFMALALTVSEKREWQKLDKKL